MTNYARRSVDRVEDRIHFGRDSQVDDRNVIITPMNPMLTDPFLLLSEDWFTTTGFQWHPHRGLETVTLVLDGVLDPGLNPDGTELVFASPRSGSGGVDLLVSKRPRKNQRPPVE